MRKEINMAMLAEPKTKQKWSSDPRNTAWTNGKKLLYKLKDHILLINELKFVFIADHCAKHAFSKSKMGFLDFRAVCGCDQ